MLLTAQKYNFLLNQISDAILLENADRKVVLVNQQFCQLFKIPYPPEQLTGFDCVASAKLSANLFKHPEKFLTDIDIVLANAAPIVNEFIELADGAFFLRDYLPIIEEGRNAGHLWIYKNKTGEFALQKEVSNQEEFYKNILDNLPADIALFNPQHQYVFVNKNGIANAEMREWIIGKDDFEYARLKNIPTELANCRRLLFNEALQKGETIEFEETNTNKNGSLAYNLRKFYPLTNEQGSVYMVVGYGININNVKHKQQQLEKSEKNFRNLLNNLNEVVLTIDKNFVITYVNPAWEQMMGYLVSETVNQPLATFFPKNTYQDIVLLIYEYINRKNSKSKGTCTIELINKHGAEKYLRVNISQQQHSILEESQIMVFISDITEQIKGEWQFKRMVQKEKNLNELKSAFIRMVSHELRTPLAIIQTTVELLEMHLDNNKLNAQNMRRDYHSIQEEITRMTEIMRELLDVSQLESQKVVIKPHPESPRSIIKEILNKKFTPWKDGRKPTLIFKGYKGKLGIDVFATSRIVSNITENAFKYSHKNSKVTISVRICRNEWSILWLDEGIGIYEKDMHKLFTSFKRGTNAVNIPGTGMGLVIVKYFLESLQGTIHIKSTINKGTCVLICIPNLPVVHL